MAELDDRSRLLRTLEPTPDRHGMVACQQRRFNENGDIILVSECPDALDLEVWEPSPNPRRKTRNTPATIPTATKKLQIDDAGNFNPANASLTIPYAILYDNSHPSAIDIVFSHVLLSELAHHIFQHSQRPIPQSN